MQKLLFLLALLSLPMGAFAQMGILGTWLDAEKRGQVEIYRSENGKYYGKIVWLKTPNDPKTGKPQLDDKNPDPALRNRPVMGLVVLRSFHEQSPTVLTDGYIYNPKDNKTYACILTLKDPATLYVRGYIGISLIGKTETWTRVK